MSKDFPLSHNEEARLASLSWLEIVDTPREPEFDTLVDLACAIFNVPIALISLVESERQWFKAVRGLDVCSTERRVAFCNYPVASGSPLVVDDAAHDARFSSNTLVTGALGIRFYAGVPLSIEPGIHLGTLCILDKHPRAFTVGEMRQLRDLAGLANALLRLHAAARQQRDLAAAIEIKNQQLTSHAQALERCKVLFDKASELTRTGAWEWSVETKELTWTDGMYDLNEMPRGVPITPEQALLFYPDHTRQQLREHIDRHAALGRQYSFEGPMFTAKGKKRWMRLVGDFECKDGVVVRWFGMRQDITEQKAMWDQVCFLADCDPLTGLANRNSFQTRINRDEKTVDRCMALFLIDLDGFKTINDSFGHSVGDECLKQLAGRLQRIGSETDLVARLGGDEFAMLLDMQAEGRMVEGYAELILAELRRPVRWDGQSFQLSGSVGVALTDQDAPGELFVRADLALYAAKDSGRNTFCAFEPYMKAKAERRFNTVRSVSKALEHGELELFYQPKLVLTDNTLAGFEALLRWRPPPQGELVTAEIFAAAFEDPELSDRIGEWVVEEALGQASEWQRRGYDFGHIAINLGAAQFRNSAFADRLIRQISERGLQPDMIEIEITERVFLNPEAAATRKILEKLRAAGLRIALDDFGTGYASLSHLRAYPVDIIKIDRSFVRDFLTSPPDHAIVGSMLFLARHMHLDVVAEGIETAEQHACLKALGCRYGQGFYFSKAVPADEASRLIADAHGHHGLGRGMFQPPRQARAG